MVIVTWYIVVVVYSQAQGTWQIDTLSKDTSEVCNRSNEYQLPKLYQYVNWSCLKTEPMSEIKHLGSLTINLNNLWYPSYEKWQFWNVHDTKMC